MLNTQKAIGNGKAAFALEGRMDTVTAPEPEAALKDTLGDVSELVLDFEKLEYISSAGLRVLLSARKEMNKKGVMKLTHISETIQRFLLEDVGGILVTDAEGNTVYEDARSRAILQGNTNWATACPPLREGQRGERWDLLHKDSSRTYMAVTSTLTADGKALQLHHPADSSEYLELFRDMGDYSARKGTRRSDGPLQQGQVHGAEGFPFPGPGFPCGVQPGRQ